MRFGGVYDVLFQGVPAVKESYEAHCKPGLCDSCAELSICVCAHTSIAGGAVLQAVLPRLVGVPFRS